MIFFKEHMHFSLSKTAHYLSFEEITFSYVKECNHHLSSKGTVNYILKNSINFLNKLDKEHTIITAKLHMTFFIQNMMF